MTAAAVILLLTTGTADDLNVAAADLVDTLGCPA